VEFGKLIKFNVFFCSKNLTGVKYIALNSYLCHVASLVKKMSNR